MIDLGVILLIIWMHFIADFVLQTDYMAKNKSNSNAALAAHILIYTIPFYAISWKYALINGAFHAVIDFVSSRIAKGLWIKKDSHNFFVVVGADQALHMSCLLATYWWMFK